MVEENSYVVDNNGSLLMNPPILDMIRNNQDSRLIQNNHIVYLFVNKDIPGIKFYNLSKSNNKFVTRRKLVFETEWSFLINFPNKTMIFKSDIGDIKIDTYLVSKKELFRILNIIKREENYDKIITFKIKNKKI